MEGQNRGVVHDVEMKVVSEMWIKMHEPSMKPSFWRRAYHSRADFPSPSRLAISFREVHVDSLLRFQWRNAAFTPIY